MFSFFVDANRAFVLSWANPIFVRKNLSKCGPCRSELLRDLLQPSPGMNHVRLSNYTYLNSQKALFQVRNYRISEPLKLCMSLTLTQAFLRAPSELRIPGQRRSYRSAESRRSADLGSTGFLTTFTWNESRKIEETEAFSTHGKQSQLELKSTSEKLPK